MRQLKDDNRYGLSDAEWQKAQRSAERAAKWGSRAPLIATAVMFLFVMGVAFYRWLSGGLSVGFTDVAMIMVLAIDMGVGAYCLLRLERSVVQGRLFTQPNDRLLSRFTSVNSVALAFVVVMGTDLPFWAYFALGMVIMSGAMLGLFEYFIRKGVKMQEEQDLTV
ncbi:MAG: DUF2975 domain-containing protein [Prevotella sp.]|nr:DUF2975 domain-containing protein [Prevotella sp.]